MAMYCPRPDCVGNPFDDSEFMCFTHRVDLVSEPPPSLGDEPAASTPPADTGRAWRVDVCWNCGVESPNPENTSCLRCNEALVPPRLLLDWETGKVRLGPGETAELGREGPYAKIFREYGNVSRMHATVGVEPNGDAWIHPRETPNGTFRPGDPDEELSPDRRHMLGDGMPLRFARNHLAKVAVFALPNS